MSLFGLMFWTIVTSNFQPIQVGIASTLIATAEFIITIGFLGMESSVIRFMKPYNGRLIKTAFIITGLFVAFLSVIFVLFVELWQPRLNFLREFIPAQLFVLLIVLYLYFKLLTSVFVGQKNAKLVFFKDMLFNVLKILGIASLVYFGLYEPFGIFTVWMCAAAFAFFVSFPFADTKKGSEFNREGIRKLATFSGTNYVANFLELIPETLVPILITAIISPFYTAIYYVDWMIASILFFIPISIGKNMLASESSQSIHRIRETLKFSYSLLIPAVIVILFFSDYILLIFGRAYSVQGANLLRLLAVSSVPLAINAVYIARMNLKHNMRAVILTHFSIVAGTLVIGYFLINLGIIAIGIGWLASQVTVALALSRGVLKWKD